MKYKGSCHCGQVAFEIEGEIPATLTRCTCSFCSKRGVLHAYYTPEQFHLTIKTGDAIYRWQSKLVAHHFCTAVAAVPLATAQLLSQTAVGTKARDASV